MKNKKLAQPLLIILAVLIVAGAVIFYFTHDAAYVMSEDGFQVSAGEESMTLTVNGEEIELGPLSSITLGQDAYYLYNTATKEIKLDHLNVDKVEAKNADYSIDLVNDILYTSSGDKILLYTKTDQLEDLK